MTRKPKLRIRSYALSFSFLAVSAVLLAGCGGSSGAKTGAAEAGELVLDSVEVYAQGSEQVFVRLNYGYDANGNVTSMDTYSRNEADALTNSHSQAYRYNDSNQVIYSRSYTIVDDGTELESSECTMSYEFLKTQAIRTENCQLLWEGEDDGSEKIEVVYAVSETGKTLSTTRHLAEAGDELSFFSYILIKLDDDDKPLIETEYDDLLATVPLSEIRYTYNDKGWLVLEETDLNYDGAIDSSVAYKMDQQGNTVYSATDGDMDGTIDIEAHLEYDSSGREQTATYDGYFDGVVDGVTDLKFVYNWRQL